MTRLALLLALLGPMVLPGCDLCWPRGGTLQECRADDDDDTVDDDDTGDDDDSGDDDSGDDDDSTPHPCDRQTWGGEVIDAAAYDVICVHEGTFWMGSPKNEDGRSSDEEQHRVELSRPFLLGRTEVTQVLWQTVWGAPTWDCIYGCSDSHPALNLTWIEAAEWLNTLSELEDLDPVYTLIDNNDATWDQTANGWRFPTEAEWEYAARADELYVFSGSDDWADVGWCGGAADPPYEARSVGERDPNLWGFVDMTGNAAEWTWDTYEDYPSTGITLDPTGDPSGFTRTHRGGAFPFTSSAMCRNARRGSNWTTDENWNRGFRMARTVPLDR